MNLFQAKCLGSVLYLSMMTTVCGSSDFGLGEITISNISELAPRRIRELANQNSAQAELQIANIILAWHIAYRASRKHETDVDVTRPNVPEEAAVESAERSALLSASAGDLPTEAAGFLASYFREVDSDRKLAMQLMKCWLDVEQIIVPMDQKSLEMVKTCIELR